MCPAAKRKPHLTLQRLTPTTFCGPVNALTIELAENATSRAVRRLFRTASHPGGNTKQTLVHRGSGSEAYYLRAHKCLFRHAPGTRYASDENVHCTLFLWIVDYGVCSTEILRPKVRCLFPLPQGIRSHRRDSREQRSRVGLPWAHPNGVCGAWRRSSGYR